MHNTTSVLENDTHNLLWDFDIQTHHLITARRPDLIIINNNSLRHCGFCCPGWSQSKIERKWKEEQIPRPWIEETVEHESNGYTNYNWFSWFSHRRIIKGTGGLRNKRTSGDHPNYYIIEIGHNTEKSFGDLRRLAVAQTPVKDHLPKLMLKTLKE